jgi:hypothetical protein
MLSCVRNGKHDHPNGYLNVSASFQTERQSFKTNKGQVRTPLGQYQDPGRLETSLVDDADIASKSPRNLTTTKHRRFLADGMQRNADEH